MTGRKIAGLVAMVVGVVWVLQGVDIISNSKLMSGSAFWAVMGVVLLVLGAALLRGARNVEE